MAEIKLVFKPNYDEVTRAISAIKQDIQNSLGHIKITIDSGAQQATQSLAANLQNVSQAATGVNRVLKETETYVDGALVKSTKRAQKAVGEYVESMTTATKAGTKQTETFIHNEEEKRKAAEKTAKEAEKLRERELLEAEKHRQEQIKRDEKWQKDEIAYEKETARQIQEINKQKRATWETFVKEQQQYEADQHRKTAEAIQFEAGEQKKLRVEKENAQKASVELERQYSNLIRQIQTLKAQYPEGIFDAIEQQAIEARDALRQLDSTSESYAQDVNKLGSVHKQLQRDVANVRSETQKLDRVTESFWMNIQKFARWYIGGNFVVKIVHSLREALSTMKEVDTELANIQKVTDRTNEQMKATADAAYSVASAYGVAAKDYLESVADFAKAGFGDQAEQLAEVATKTQLVGDVSSAIANKFLIASNAAWKMNGNIETLNKTLDAANIIENNYATTIEKLAQGMPIAASVAAQAGMTFDETIAALGTITSMTQETGTKAATALRALILNIIGAVGEYEDGIEVTEDSVKSLDGILQTYAKDALEAAKAAGTVVNPMEAIAALAKASEEGLVNQAELFEILSGLGGKLRTNQLTALVQNYGTYLEMLDKTKESAGSADKEISVMLDTWEAKTNILKNTWTEFVAKTIDTDIIKWILDASAAVLEFADNAGLAATAILGIVTVFKGKEIVGGVKDAIKAFQDLGKTLSGLSGGFSAVTTWVGLAMAAISAAIMVYKRLDRAREESVAKAAEEAKAYEDSVQKYNDLVMKLSDEKTGREELLEAIKKVDSAYDDEAGKLKTLNDLREIAIKLTKDEAKAAAQKYINENTAGYLTAKRVLGNEGVKLASYQAAVDSYTAQYQRDGKLNWFDQWNLNQAQKYIDKYSERVENARQVVEQYETAQSILNDTFEATAQKTENLNEETGGLTPRLKEATEAVDLLQEKLNDLSNSADTMDAVIGGVTEAVKKFGANSVQTYDAMKALEAAIPGSTDKLYDFQTASLLVDEALFEDKESVLDLIDAMRQVDFSNAINEAYRAADAAWDMAEAWTAALPMMGGVFANAAMASSAYLGSLQQQRRSWTDRTSALRQRADYRPSGSGTASSGGGKSSDSELERLKNIVSLRKAELAFLQAKGASEEEVIAKNKEIQAALHDQAEYMRSIGANEEDILALSTEWWKVQNDIVSAQEKSKKAAEEQLKLQQEMFDQVKSLVDTYYEKIVSDKEKELSLEERILAVQQAEAALANAQAERTVRYYNAATGQWEWQANAKNVKSAQDALKKAQDDLNKYQREQAWKEFKSAWEYVSEQIKAGAMTFKEAYDYMYDSMKGIQDKYGVDLSMTLEDSIGGFKNLNYGIDGLTQEVADSLGNSVGVLRERLQEYETAVDALKQAMDDAAEKVKSGEFTIEEAYAYLRERAKEISERYGIDMTGALDEAIAGMDKTNMSIDDLWKSVVINLMKVNSSRWFDANAEERAMLHAQNEYLGNLIGATYDPSGYWSLNGQHLYDPKGGGSSGVSASGAGGTSGGTGTASRHAGQESAWTPATANASTDGWTIRNANGSYKVRHETPLTEANEEQAALIRQMEEAAARGDTQAVLDLDYQLRQEGTFASVSNGDGPPSGIAYSISGTSIGGTVTLANGELWDSGIEPGTLIRDADGKQWEVGADGHTLIETDRRGNNWYDGWSGEPEYDRGGILRGIGGIKRTRRDEIILPPDLTKKMLDPVNNDLSRRGLETIRNLLGMADLLPQPIVREETMNTGDTYTINGVSIGEQQAKVTTVYELARLARAL